MTKEQEIDRLHRCITMAMGCISPLSVDRDERLAWYRLLDAIEGREARDNLDATKSMDWARESNSTGQR